MENQQIQQSTQQSHTNISVETQLALMNQTMTQTSKVVEEIKNSLNKLSESTIRKSDFDALKLQVGALEKDRDADRAKFELHLQDYLVAKSENAIVKRLVYGAVGVILTLVMGAIVGLVIISNK